MDNEVTNDAYYLLGTCVPTITTTCTVYPSKQGATYVYSLPLPSFTTVLFFFLFQPPPPCVKNANKERKKKAAFHRKLDPVSSSLQPYIVDRYLLGSCVIPPLCSALGLARRRFLGETACARSAVALESIAFFNLRHGRDVVLCVLEGCISRVSMDDITAFDGPVV